MEKLPYVCLYRSYWDGFRNLSDVARGKLLTAILQYAETGEDLALTGPANIIWPMVRSQMDRDMEKYRKKCEMNRINGAKGGRPRKIPLGYSETDGLFEKPKKAKEKENEKENNNENKNENKKEWKRKETVRSFLDLARELSESDSDSDYYDLTREEVIPSDTPEYLRADSPEPDIWHPEWRSGWR